MSDRGAPKSKALLLAIAAGVLLAIPGLVFLAVVSDGETANGQNDSAIGLVMLGALWIAGAVALASMLYRRLRTDDRPAPPGER